MVAPIRYLSRRQQEQKIGILQNTEEVKVLEVIGRVGIGTTIFDAEYNLDVRGTANVSGSLSVGQIISGAGNTFSDLTVTGDTDLQSDVIIGGGLTVTGVSTFTSDVDINASVDISSNLTIAGVSTFQDTALFDDGTEAEPSISFINDTDLGLYRPVDNEIAFTNGGSESIRITSDGRVGIGTTQPFSKLSVFSTDVVTETRIESTDYAGYASILLKSGDIEGAFYASSSEDVIVLRNNSNTTGSALGLAGTRSSGADIAIFRETRNVLIGNNPLASSQTGTANQKLQVQSGAYISGDVGIGTTNPSQKLDVNGNVNISGELHGPELFIIDPAAVGDNTGAVRIKGDLYVDGTEFIVDSQNILLADYRVGIATTVATNVLLDGAGISIGDTNIEKTFTYNNTANTLESSIGLGVTEGGEFKTGTDSVLNRTTLGPTVVNSSLTSVGTLISLEVTGVSTFNSDLSIADKITHIGDTDTAIRFPANDTFTIETAGSERLRVTSTGDVGIGTTDPQAKLDVNGDVSIASTVSIGTTIDIVPYNNLGSLSFEGSAGQLFSITNNLTSGSIFSVNDVSGIPSIDVDADGTIQLAPFGSTEYVGVGKTNPQAKLDVVGDTLISGDVGIGTTNPTQKLDVDGNVAIGGSVYDANNLPGNNGQVLSNVTGFGISWTDAPVGEVNVNDITSGSYYIGAFETTGTTSQAYIETTNPVVITSDGRIGIGSTLPTQKLDVSGSVSISNFIYDSTGSTGVPGQVLKSTVSGTEWEDETGGTGTTIGIRSDGTIVGTASTVDFYDSFNVVVNSGIASIRISDVDAGSFV